MSDTGFAGYPCHPTQLTTQLSLMTSNSNNSTTDCCPSSGGTDSRTNTTNVTNNTNMNLSANEENQISSAVHNPTQPLSSPSSVCALTTPYDSRIISGYPRIGGFYGPSYSEQNSFYTSGTNPFYSSFGNPYDLKDPNGNGWTPIPQSTFYPYDPTIYSPYSERYSAIDSANRRKNVTRETTNTLKAWLYEHRKNPYPTKGEKIMLAIITKMTLTQVSTWFANARRRLKKENKMTWEPRNKSDGHDSDDDDSFRDTDDNSLSIGDNPCLNGATELSAKKESDSMTEKSNKSPVKPDSVQNHLDGVTNIGTIGQRPKIWSLAQTATSDSPPYNGKVVVPSGPEEAIALSDYHRTCPQRTRFAATNLGKCGQSWPEDHCVANLGSARSAAMHLFSSDTIGSHSYFNSHPSKAFANNAIHPSHLQLSAPVPHLMGSPTTESFNNSYNGIRPIIESQSCHTLPAISDNFLSNGSVSKSNAFVCKVFPEYLTSGPDALSLNDDTSERGGSTLSVEDSTLSSSLSPNLESHNSLVMRSQRAIGQRPKIWSLAQTVTTDSPP